MQKIVRTVGPTVAPSAASSPPAATLFDHTDIPNCTTAMVPPTGAKPTDLWFDTVTGFSSSITTTATLDSG